MKTYFYAIYRDLKKSNFDFYESNLKSRKESY
jgi:hypothetical protein